jgi:glycosyltransferase involved in cell wall biosynthesis
MRICFITNNFIPFIDGVGDYTLQVARQMADKGHDVYIVCKADPQIPTTYLGIKVLPIVSGWTPKQFSIAAQQINEISPDWILVQYVPYSFHKWGTPVLFPFIFKKINLEKSRILLTVHEPYIRFQWWPLKTFLVGQLQRFSLRALARHANLIVTSIDRYVMLIKKYANKPIYQIPIPSNITPIEVSQAEIEEYRATVAPGNRKIVSTFGIRDHRLLVAVFKDLLKKDPDIQLLVIGVTSDASIYESIKEHVYLTGYLTEAEVFRFLKASDVFFMPDEIRNKTEGGTCNKSGSLAAALAAGLPVVGLKGDMNNALLQQAPHVYLERFDITTIVERLLALIREEKNNGNYLFWQQHLSIAVVADTYDKIITEKKHL